MTSSTNAPHSDGGTAPVTSSPSVVVQERHEDLEHLERRLRNEVDADLFEDPKRFRSLHRVIDVLGARLLDGETTGSSADDVSRNPAYRALVTQRGVVETAVEHMSVRYCSDLNGSVVSVGGVARRFGDAVYRVKSLRRQVRDIRRQLRSSEPSRGEENGGDAAAARDDDNSSLRELWLKKLESEAVLSLLNKLEVMRRAPSGFDALASPRQGRPRVGAAVTLLSNAIDTMFTDDVAQIRALTKIMEQLMTRKQRAEEMVWETLQDVVFLRTGNRTTPTLHDGDGAPTRRRSAVPGGDLHRNRSYQDAELNPLLDVFDPTSVELEFDDEDDEDDSTTSSSFSGQKPQQSKEQRVPVVGRLIPQSVLDTELDLIEDEKLCLEDDTTSRLPWETHNYDADRSSSDRLPRYSDATQALRILVESVIRLKRLDDAERFLLESVEREIRGLAEREQRRTRALLERRKDARAAAARKETADAPPPKEFEHHLCALLYAFGNVLLRLSHLAQILRTRIASDPRLSRLSSSDAPPSVMRDTIDAAVAAMQREVRTYLCACLAMTDDKGPRRRDSVRGDRAKAPSSYERGIFRLDVARDDEDEDEDDDLETGGGDRASSDLTADEFVLRVLVPSTNAHPRMRYALSFRKRLERWTTDVADLRRELSDRTGTNDAVAPTAAEGSALDFLDGVVENEVLPVLQDLAVNCTVTALERDDAFEPPVVAYGNSAAALMTAGDRPDMCVACRALLDAVSPLTSALRRLPRGSTGYAPLVANLDYSLLTFTSRVKQRMEEICAGKKAHELLEETDIGAAMESRRAYSALLTEYGERPEILDNETTAANDDADGVRARPLAPSSADTRPRHSASSTPLDPVRSLEREDDALEREIPHLLDLLRFDSHNHGAALVVCDDEETMRAACLAHSLLSFAHLLETRLRNRDGRWARTTTRALRDAVRTVRAHGARAAKFLRLDALVQTVKRAAGVPLSSALSDRDRVRLPSCVHDLGDHVRDASDALRATGGNAIAGYALSSLEQYVPLLLMQAVRRVGASRDDAAALTLNGVEALDRSGSVLYRDLKGATSFEGSFWDDAVAADAFERSASFIALLELTMDELVATWRERRSDFSEGDYKLMFSMNAPRRKGDSNKFLTLTSKSYERTK